MIYLLQHVINISAPINLARVAPHPRQSVRGLFFLDQSYLSVLSPTRNLGLRSSSQTLFLIYLFLNTSSRSHCVYLFVCMCVLKPCSPAVKHTPWESLIWHQLNLSRDNLLNTWYTCLFWKVKTWYGRISANINADTNMPVKCLQWPTTV